MPKMPRLLRKVAVPLVSLTVFLEDILIILGGQWVWLHVLSPGQRLQRLLDGSKRAFIALLATILELVAPSQVRITADSASVPPGTFKVDPRTHSVSSLLLPRSISICNHQIYTDWVFLWWLAYTGDLGGRVYIMLKKSLEKVPLLGFGMQNYRFIFMSRKWQHDRETLVHRLGELDASPLPYNLILFPEGTNFTANTRGKSQVFGAKVGKAPLDHALLPHTTGLRQCILSLRPSLDVLYDVTMGYSGVAANEYAESAYGLKDIFLEGKYPRLVDIHVRAFKVQDIPVDDEQQFDLWLDRVWREKDALLAGYYREGSFFTDATSQHSVVGAFSVSRWERGLVLLVPAITGLLGLWFLFAVLRWFLAFF